MHRAAIACATFASLLALASPAVAAAPNYILVSGRGLAHPVLLADWNENLRLLAAVARAPRARGDAVRGLSRRPRFDLAEFWNWSYLPLPKRASQANQHGVFYPTHGSQPAVISVMVDGSRVPRLVPQSVQKIFHEHGIPLRL
jgi:hypothetical protein